MKGLRSILPLLAGILLTLAAPAPASGALCTLQKLNTVLADYIEFGSTTQTCDWRGRFAPDFAPWNGGSENRPVVAAAIKLFADGDSAAQIWWLDFLENQLGDQDDASLPLKVRRFHGSELFPSGYDAHTTRSVAAAHLWARQNAASTIESLARRWLRATWYTYSLAAGKVKVNTLYAIRDTTVVREVPSTGNSFVQVPSPRSVEEGYQPTIPAFARARGLAEKQWEPNELKRLSNLLQQRWGTNTNPNVYGLDGTDRTNISNIINSASFSVATLQSVYGNARFYRNLHFFAFSHGTNGSRVSVLEPDGANYNHERIIFAVRFDNDTATGWLLAPWWNHTTNLGSCSYNLSTRKVTATGDFTRTLDMPTGAILFHVKLGTTGLSVPIP